MAVTSNGLGTPTPNTWDHSVEFGPSRASKGEAQWNWTRVEIAYRTHRPSHFHRLLLLTAPARIVLCGRPTCLDG